MSVDTLDSRIGDGMRPRFKAIAGACIGNLIEWYDWTTYTTFSLYFAKTFFPSGDSTAQLLNTAGVFALGFLMRPLGGWLFGRFADRYGRKAGLTLSVMLMCIGSLLIACTPGHGTIGVGAPMLLIAARLLQGLSVGGEYGASATYLSEIAGPGQRGFISSFQYVTMILGQLIALGVLMLLQFVFLTSEQLDAWGWRIPFALGAAGALFAMYLRRRLAESAVFTNEVTALKERGSLTVLLHHWRAAMVVIGLTLGGTVAFYTYSTYAQRFLVNTSGLTREQASVVIAAALLVFISIQPIFGALSDRIGRRPLLVGFGVCGSILTVPLMTKLADAPSPLAAFTIVSAGLVICSGYTSINAAVKAELFPTEIRALGVALPYALTVAIFGGTAEYVALWLKSVGRESLYFWYVSGCIAVSLAVYLTMHDTRDAQLER
ncbi:MAG: MFS transporter [Rhodospirillaceae bacterium]|nr:MAG: MFS transporter [Rhodospirillaceae bacterium]